METAVDKSWVSVCKCADVIPHVGVNALLEGRQIAIFYLHELDEYFAIDNYDPLSGANVLSRGIVGDINGEPVVASPLYKQHYSLKTGSCIEREDVNISVYPVRVRVEHIEVALP